MDTITIVTNTERQSSRLYELMREYLDFFNPSDTKHIMLMSIVPDNHPYTTKGIQNGLSITFSGMLSSDCLYFFSNVARYTASVLNTEYYYDNEVSDSSTCDVRWPSDKPNLLFITRWFLKYRERDIRDYFYNAIMPRIEQLTSEEYV